MRGPLQNHNAHVLAGGLTEIGSNRGPISPARWPGVMGAK